MVDLKINKKLLPIKAHFFFFNAGTAPIIPFLPTMARQLGFSSSVVGIIYTFLPIIGLIVKPLFGAVADRLQIQKLLFLIFEIITAITLFGIMFVPEAPVTRNTNFECGTVTSEFEICRKNSTGIDSCLINNINSLYENEEMMCQMNCVLKEANMWKTICKYWNVSELCQNRNHTDNEIIRFTAHLPINESEQIGDCVYFRIRHIHFSDNIARRANCPSDKSFHNSTHINSVCKTSCSIPEVNELITQNVESESVIGSYQFWVLFILMALSWAGMAVVVSVGDAICFEMLGDRPNHYGYQRLWGSVGWGILSLLTGYLIDRFSQQSAFKNYNIAFYLMLVMLSFDFIVSYKLQYNQSQISVNILQDVGKLLTEIRIFVFVLWCIFIGMCTGLIWNFLFWYLEDLAENCDTKANIKTLEGLIMTVQCFGGELPFLFLSSFILKKLGHINTMNLVLFCEGCRLVLYSLLIDPWWSLPIELLHGVTFGVFIATMTSYASIVAPLGTETTVQGLVGAVFEGIGVSFGSFLGGFLLENFNGSVTFRSYGIGCFIILILHVIIQWYLQKRNITNQKDLNSQSRYAAPGDAIHMIDDHQEVQLETY